jgi:hypothetical protein
MLENTGEPKHRAWETGYAPSVVATEGVALKYEDGTAPRIYPCVKLSGRDVTVAGCPQQFEPRCAMFRFPAPKIFVVFCLLHFYPARAEDAKGTIDRLPTCRPRAHKRMLRRNNGGFLLNPANVLAWVLGRSLSLLWPGRRRKDDWIIAIDVK